MDSAAYSVDNWDNFFVASAGAAAALTGLLFVALSINLDKVLKIPRITGRAAATLGILVVVMLTGCFGLAPGQSNAVIGIEFAVLGAMSLLQAVWVRFAHRKDPSAGVERPTTSFVLSIVPTIPLTIGGLSFAAGFGGGLYWTLAGVVLGFFTSVANAWVILIEINR
jgi:modulator of FtsH protease